MLEESDYSIRGDLGRKRFLGFFSERYCALSGTTLYVFKEKNDKEPEMKIEIGQKSRIEPLSSHDLRFNIIDINNDEHVFEAPDSNSLMKWLLALRGCTFVTPDFDMSMFDIISVIGRGFYGKVMLCESHFTHKLYAVKSVHKNRLLKDKKVHTIIAERDIMAKLQHPFIVGLKFAFQTPSKFYLGLEYVPGGELFFHMQREGCIPINDVRIYVAEIMLALFHLHRCGVIYRDLKPENILLDSDGHIKLTDFGLAKDMSYAGYNANTFCGTAEYVAPEIVKRERYDFAIDWWALGILTYEMLFGKTPFTSTNKSRLFHKICDSDPVFPEKADNNAVQFIKILLEKDPKNRPGFHFLKNLPFFQGIDFNDVLNKKYQPSFIPPIDNKNEPTNFDPEFTSEAPADSYVPSEDVVDDQFYGFSYVDSKNVEYYDCTNFAKSIEKSLTEEKNTDMITKEEEN